MATSAIKKVGEVAAVVVEKNTNPLAPAKVEKKTCDGMKKAKKTKDVSASSDHPRFEDLPSLLAEGERWSDSVCDESEKASSVAEPPRRLTKYEEWSNDIFVEAETLDKDLTLKLIEYVNDVTRAFGTHESLRISGFLNSLRALPLTPTMQINILSVLLVQINRSNEKMFKYGDHPPLTCNPPQFIFKMKEAYCKPPAPAPAPAPAPLTTEQEMQALREQVAQLSSLIRYAVPQHLQPPWQQQQSQPQSRAPPLLHQQQWPTPAPQRMAPRTKK